jgi:alginate O-acetyltransferase complex protein AlgI
VNFTSPLFVFVVLPAVLVAYWLCPRRAQNALLLMTSVALYAWGAPEFVVVVLLFSTLDWLLAFQIAAAPEASRKRGALTAFGVVANLGVLVVAKYANFGVEILNGARTSLALAPVPWTEIALPIGVSFVIFEKISYLVDVARGTVQPLRSLHSYLLYTFLFPKMFAGPIVRFHTIERQLEDRAVTDDDRAYGLSRFAIGLAKKALVADTLGSVANDVFRMPASELNMPTAWLGAVCFTLQAYFDFSGYSDIAIGLARCFGFRLSENFNHPFGARSPREWWSRWHISLSSWIRDYLYIPLGGSRGSEFRTHANLWICFLACGLWHGANWTFVAWGAVQGVALTVERHYDLHVGRKWPRVPAVLLTFTFIVLTLVLFRSQSMAQASMYYRAMFSASGPFFIQVFVDSNVGLTLAVALALSVGPGLPGTARVLAWFGKGKRVEWLMKASAIPLVVLAVACTLASTATPFIYFKF